MAKLNRGMTVGQTERGTLRVAWSGGALEINLIPANGLLPMSCGARPQWGGRMLYLHDNVGIVALRLQNGPEVPRICWDNREHHFWKGFNGGFRPRNTVVSDIRVTPAADGCAVEIAFGYVVDFVRTTHSWRFVEPARGGEFLIWDTRFTFENLNPFTLENYMAFFACYHPPGDNFYVNLHGDMAACADSFFAYADEERRDREERVCAEFRELVKGWTAGIMSPTHASVLYGRPALLSSEKEWFGGGRHMILVEPDACLSMVSAMRQARDYMLAPPQRHLKPGDSFRARVRHVIGRIRGAEDIARIWNEFAKDASLTTARG